VPAAAPDSGFRIPAGRTSSTSTRPRVPAFSPKSRAGMTVVSFTTEARRLRATGSGTSRIRWWRASAPVAGNVQQARARAVLERPARDELARQLEPEHPGAGVHAASRFCSPYISSMRAA